MEKPIIINLYWNDLSKAGQESLINGGFTPTQAQLDEEDYVGAIATNREEADLSKVVD